MFYGTINSDASIDTSCAFSNNFTVTVSSGTFVISFNECLQYPPTLDATAIGTNTTKNNYVGIQWSMSQSTPGTPFQATLMVWKPSHSNPETSHGFSFKARSGQSLVFNAKTNTTLSLGPQITTFTYNSATNDVLTLSTGINGLDSTTAQPGTGTYSAFLDKGTVLLGVLEGGGTMNLEIPTTVKDGSGNTWNLTGWTYGGGSGSTGVQWEAGSVPNTWVYPLSLEPQEQGQPLPPMTTPETFVIMATHDGATLTADPLIRLSSVPPAGISV